MIARLANLRKHRAVFEHLTGLTVAVFDALAGDVVPVLEAEHRRSLDRPNRQRAVRGGDDFDLEFLLERRQAVHEAEERLAAAEEFLAGCTIDAELMQAIEDAAVAHAVAAGRLADSGAPLRLAADGDVVVEAGDQHHVEQDRGEGGDGGVAADGVPGRDERGEAGRKLEETADEIPAGESDPDQSDDRDHQRGARAEEEREIDHRAEEDDRDLEQRGGREGDPRLE